MPQISYSRRLILDKYFLEWFGVNKLNSREKSDIIKHLMYIHLSSREYHDEHNLILESDLSDMLEKGIITQQELMRHHIAMIYKDPSHLFSDEDDRISKVVKTAIYLSGISAPNFKVAILTSPAMREKYLHNPHYKNITSVSIESGDDALKVINELFDEYQREKS